MGVSLQDGAAGAGVSDGANARALTLLVPGALHRCGVRSERERRAVLEVLQATATLLREPPAQHDLSRLTGLHASLPAAPVRAAAHSGDPDALKSREGAEYDRFFRVTHVESEASACVVAGSVLAAAHAFVQIAAAGTPMAAAHATTQRSGFAVFADVLIRQLQGPSGDGVSAAAISATATQAGDSPLERASASRIWRELHWAFFVDVQALTLCLRRFALQLDAGSLEQARVELDAAAALMRAAGAAMELAGSFARTAYDSEVRPSMTPPAVAVDNFSGLMSRDHAELIRTWQSLKPHFANLPSTLADAHGGLLEAYGVLAASHRAVCARFGGDSGGSLRTPSETAVDTLDRFERGRAALLDPTGAVRARRADELTS